MNAIDLVHGDKKHRASKSGAKAKKKADHSKKKRGLSNERHNPRAFSVANIVRTKRTQQRNRDRAQKKEVVPLINRAEDLPPPILVVVVGPKGVGKSTLIRSLVKLYTGQNMTDIKGPVTVVAGKKLRLTFFECPMDIYSMTDLAKIADLVLLMIDSSYGFEMETFEFLNLLQLHGFPKVVGVMTHMDKFKVNKSLQKTKKRLKNRFWTEIYKGAKLFDFTGTVNGKYLKHEVKRLSMYISRLKFRPLVWRNTHPYVLVDRVEDITPTAMIRDNPVCNREISFFGYLRGTHLKASMQMHLIGGGDFYMDSVSTLEDPCPMPSQNERTTLKSSKDNFLYAPMSNVGRVKIDKDGMYIEIKDIHYTKPDMLDISDQQSGGMYRDLSTEEGARTPAGLLRSMQDVQQGVDERLHGAELSLFKGDEAVKSSAVRAQDDDSTDDDSEDDESGGEESDSEVAGSGSEVEVDESEEDSEIEQDDGSCEDESDDEYNSDEYEEEDVDAEVDENDEYYSSSDSGSDKHRPNADSGLRWKDNLSEKAAMSFSKRLSSAAGNISVMERVYGKGWAYTGGLKEEFNSHSDSDESNSDSDSDDDLFRLKSESQRKEYDTINALDSSRPQYVQWQESQNGTAVADKKKERSMLWLAFSRGRSGGDVENSEHDVDPNELSNTYELLRNKFVTGDWSKANIKSNGDEGFDDDEVYGDFEDLQTGEKFGPSAHDSGAESGSDSDVDSEAGSEDVERSNAAIDEELRELNAAKKAESRLKAGLNPDDDDERTKVTDVGEEGDEEYAEKLRQELTERRDRNKGEFGDEGEQARLQYEGIRQGMYVRIVIKNVPYEFTKGFRSHLPLVLGGLLPHESTMGLITARVKRHRWHKKILKSDDVLTFSVGWRRYQSIPIFTLDDENQNRRRYLKYTPEHMHCTCSFYGPIVPPNTGILAYMKPSRNSADFRIALTGLSLEVITTSDIVKKLKLVGTPVKIHKNTAYITGMFNSQLEVAKFEGAKIKTVSGIRGQIKKSASHNGEPGQFRATFEDQILMSDLVTCRLWVPVEVKEFYNPVLTLLEATGEGEGDPAWKGMRTIAEIRRDNQIPIPVEKDSLYKPIKRVQREFSKIVVPKRLQEALPFASKPKVQSSKNKKSYMAQRAVVLEPEDKRKRAAVQMLETIRNDKVTKRVQSQKERLKMKQKEAAKVAEKFADVHKAEKRKRYTEAGKDQLRREIKKQRRA